MIGIVKALRLKTLETTETTEWAMEEIRNVESRLKILRAIVDKNLGKTLVTCSVCKGSFEICSLVYIQTHWYVTPHGCTGGDYYNAGEGNWDCPQCGVSNRLYNNPKVESLKHLFKWIQECYCKQDRGSRYERPCKYCNVYGRTRDGRVEVKS